MRRRLAPGIATLLTLVCLGTCLASGAAAATVTVGKLGAPGQECGFGSRSATTFAAPDYEIPIDGTIIEWSFETGPTAPSATTKMKVFSVSGNQYTVIGESPFGTLNPSAVNTFEVEIPVRAGDLLGLFTGEAGSRAQCFVYDKGATPEPVLLGDPLLGETRNSSGTVSEARFPMTAVILPPPTVTAVSPAGGPATGGTTVTITGTDLQRVKSVSFGGVTATSFAATPGGTSLTAVAPAGAAGTVDVRVTTAAGPSLATGADRFTYAAPAPPGGGEPGSGTTGGGSGTTGGGAPAGSSTGTGSPSPPPAAGPAPASPKVCKVPNLKGKRLAAARRAIRASGCVVGKAVRRRARRPGPARVRKQSPKPGSSVAAGRPVRIVLG